MTQKKEVRFPVKMPTEVDEMIRRAAFATGKTKNQYCLDAIKEKAKIDAAKVEIKGEK